MRTWDRCGRLPQTVWIVRVRSLHRDATLPLLAVHLHGGLRELPPEDLAAHGRLFTQSRRSGRRLAVIEIELVREGVRAGAAAAF